MKKLKILILEDNILDAELMKEEMTEHKIDFTSELVETEKDFITAIHNFKPDVILSDYTLPQFTGFEALEIAKELVPDIPFIIVTGSLSEETAVETIKRGAWNYVIKENLLRLSPAIENAITLKEEIDKNKQAEEKIRKLSKVVETTPDAIVMTDMQGNIEYVNLGLLTLGGFEDDNLIIGKSIFLFSNEEGVKQLKEEIIPTILSKGKWRGEVSVKRKDSSFFPAEMICSYILDEEGNPKYLLSQYHDITNRKKTEKALEESEKQLKTLINTMPDFVCFKDGDGRWLLANDAGISIFQLKNIDYLGKNDSELAELNKKLRGSFLTCKETDARVWKEGRSIHAEETISDADGSARIYDVTKVPVSYPDGERKGIVVLGHDITERKKAEEKIQKSEEKYRLLADNSMDAIWQMDLKLVFTFISPSVKNIMGYTVEEWVGSRLSQHVSIKDFFNMAKKALSAIKHYKEFKHLTFDVVMFRKDGTEIPVEITVKLLLNKKGLPIGFQGTTHDITERKQAEEENIKLSTAVTQSPSVIAITDLKGNLEYVNPKFSEITGYTSKEAIGQNTRILKSGEQPSEMYKELWKIISSGKEWRGEFHNKKKNGELFWEAASISPIFDKQGKMINYIKVAEDITERKQAEENLHKAHEELKKLHRGLEIKVEKAVKELREKDHIIYQQSRLASMGEMIGNIAHHWRQPITAVGAIVQNYEDAYEDGILDMDYIEKHTDIVMDILTNMSRTIDNFRFFFKSDRAKENFDIKEIILKTLKFLDSSFKYNKINVISDLAEDCIINGFPNEYSQVLLAVLSNAKDELIERDIKERKIIITLKKINDKYVVTISDNAGGIIKEVLPRVFDPYFTTKEQGKGTGIGLYMAKMIIEKNMDGKLSARNLKDGAEFRIEV